MMGFEPFVGQLSRMAALLSDSKSMGAPYIPRFGTYADGDYTPGSNATLTKNLYMWQDITIGSGKTITVASPGVLIFARDVVITGLLTASGKGGPGGAAITNAVGVGNAGTSGRGIIGGAGGNGGQGYCSSSSAYYAPGAAGVGAIAKDTIVDILNILPGFAGAGGGSGGCGYSAGYSGAGGNGGGYILISCRTLTINSGGAIRADGLNGGSGNGNANLNGGAGGGGGGGGIIVVAQDITNNGTVSVAGGAPGAPITGATYTAGTSGESGTALLLEVA